MINVVVPMAGRGSRFAGTAERGPKPLIEVQPGRIMLDYVAEYLRFDEPFRLIFVGLAEHARDPRLRAFMQRVGPTGTLVVADRVTNGPAASALLALSLVDENDELIIAYCDGAYDLVVQGFVERMRDRKADGGVLIFPASNPAFAYARIEGDSVTAVVEKQVISSDAVGGLYYFRRARDFSTAAQALLAEARNGSEVFVSTTLNHVIAGGGTVIGERITLEQRNEMGTPAELDASRAALARARTGGLVASR